ncbi:uncharacterized protein LOC135341311 isoform X2 [Halichondria panicea]|uniref:uncharacterized protein LOC135341311 isoform X2 n=1 Tax=Halichondria panicea TaxID=6063 RepID=UPI00312B8C1E
MGNNNTVPANNKPTTVFTYPDFYNQVNEVELLPAIIHHQDQDNELTNKKELYAVAKAKAQRNQSKSMLFRDYNIRSELKLIKLLIHVNKLLRECTIYAIDHMLIFRHTSSKSVPVLSMSMKELVSLLRSIRSGWGPPLELVTRMLNSKFWVMEADVWADLLIVCCWANPTTIYCEKCSKDVESTTTSCNHVVCPVCVVGKGIGPISCPECGQRLTALLFTSALTSTPEKITRKRSFCESTTAATKKACTSKACTSSGKAKSTRPRHKAATQISQTSPFTTSNLQGLFETLFPARTSWFNLGLALDMSCETLKDIRIKQREDSGDCLREMLIIRLEEELSKEEIVAALDTATVGRYSLAREAEKTL